MVINWFSVLLLIILCVHSLRSVDEKTFQHRLYVEVVLITIILLILDVLSRTGRNLGTVYPLINQVENFLLFLLNPVLPSMWFYMLISKFIMTKK